MLKPLGDRVVLKSRRKDKLLEVLSLQAQPKKNKNSPSCTLLDKVFVP